MVRRGSRFHWLAAAVLAGVAAVGCHHRLLQPETPIEAGYNPIELREPVGERDALHDLNTRDLFALAERVRQERKPAVLPPVRNVLVLSGGGSYGAFTAGVLDGWTKAGNRPQFDVVTGISTGALIAPLAFLGPDYDPAMREGYTTLRNDDVFRIKKTIRSLFSDALADNSPLGRQVERTVTPDLLRKVAEAHACGRRLYVGTTELDSRRPVIWDMGEIAARGDVAALHLFRQVVLASAAIPGFFPPVHIPVTVDGKQLEERHVDGSVSHGLFFRPPHLTAEEQADPVAKSLYGSNVYVIVAGKLYVDPAPVRPRALVIAANSVSALIYAQTRGELFKLYTACLLTGMNYYMAAMPTEFDLKESSTDFEPASLRRMFDEGMKVASGDKVWRTTPPGLEPGEGTFLRANTALTRVPLDGPPIVNDRRQPILPRTVTK